MHWIDWSVLALYFLVILGLGFYLMLRQKSAEEYYMGGRKVPAWLISASIVATQSSAVSLLGGPAFVAVRKGGGLLWLQYELAVPLAMALLIPLMVHLRRQNIISIYEYLEEKLGPGPRFFVSILFQISRTLATGVSLYATALLFSLLLHIPIVESILLIGGIALIYTMLGGILADILSDFLQLIILFGGVVIAVFVMLILYGTELMTYVPGERLETLDFQGTGWGGGHPYGFWPMLFGGLFLYLSYYGCDQSQSQRLLTGPDERTTVRSLLYNGLLRFPLVVTYVLFGLLLAGFIRMVQPSWMHELAQAPDRLVPFFIRDYFPVGARGLFMAGILAAAMSSFDSAYNSISAVTFRDLGRIWAPFTRLTARIEVRISRVLTFFWGGVSMGFAIWISQFQKTTVIELINMVGSLLYGPIFAAFFIARFMKNLSSSSVLGGLITGPIANLYIARNYPEVSWLWWNVIGCVVTLCSAMIFSYIQRLRPTLVEVRDFKIYRQETVVLVLYFFVIFLILFLMHVFL